MAKDSITPRDTEADAAQVKEILEHVKDDSVRDRAQAWLKALLEDCEWLRSRANAFENERSA